MSSKSNICNENEIVRLKVALCTLGCKTNQYESQLMREKIKGLELDIVPFNNIAQIYIVNTCTVTKRSDQKACSLIRKIKKINHLARIIVTGCYAERASEEIKKKFPEVMILTNKEKKNIARYLLKNNKKDFKIEGISEFNEHSRAFVKIQDGCDAFCSYCIVPYVRNELSSRDHNEIIEEIKRLVSNGYKEIVLTGIRLGKYKWKDIGLKELIEDIAEIENLARIRLSSIEPQDITEELLDTLKNCSKVCSHLHLPLQSGNDEILQKMNRKYSLAQYEAIVDRVRRKIPEIGITTDIIVGFPGEGDNHFKRGVEFIEKIAFSKMHIFRFSPRKGTVADQLQGRVDTSVVKERSDELLRLNRIFEDNFINKFKGKVEEVLIERKKNGFFWGLMNNYIKVKVIPQTGIKKNCLLKLKIVDIEHGYANGEPV